ncbi:hypothetical protein [Nocardiopsis chromatogenes]|uniref:hypothetical protein n=1 Tax=Nocardiopsis chromatogenes TaxID=280239 RepID=UPI00034CAF50|nr:hypothetical protein [Nocardiopsis chromatogenes]
MHTQGPRARDTFGGEEMDDASGPEESAPVLRGASVLADVFSPESEARVCALVLGERRHGLPGLPSEGAPVHT